MWPDIRLCNRPEPEPEPNIAMAAPLLYIRMMCMKLCNLPINCSGLMSVIWFVLLLLHVVMHNICLFERQLVLTNDWTAYDNR